MNNPYCRYPLHWNLAILLILQTVHHLLHQSKLSQELVLQRLNEIDILNTPGHTTETCRIGTIPVIRNGMRNRPRAFLPLPSVFTCILLCIDFFAVMPSLWIFLIDLPKSDILYLPIYRNIFISTGL